MDSKILCEGLLTYRVTIDPREGCIACCNCHTNCPEVFELNPDDGLSQITYDYRPDLVSLGEGVVPETFGECVWLAEDLCPVSIIHVEESA